MRDVNVCFGEHPIISYHEVSLVQLVAQLARGLGIFDRCANISQNSRVGAIYAKSISAISSGLNI
jgi:hypothetical protein